MPRLLEQTYSASPVWAQQVMVAAYGWWWYRRRFNKHFHRLVDQLKAAEYWTVERFQAYQEEKLAELLRAGRQSPYYRQVFAAAGVNSSMQPFEALRRLPLLSKETLRTRASELLTQSPPPARTIVFNSSGSTGTPTDIYYTPDFHALELAVPEARNINWVGLNYRHRRLMLGVRKVCAFDQKRPPFWRYSPAENMAYASVYHLSSAFLPYYLEFLRFYSPAIVMGYPSALNTIASYALEKDDMPGPAKAVFTTSETLTAEARQRIESAFRCQIYDRYCAVEMCLFASQCEYGRYHVSPEIGVIEIVDHEGKEAPPGELGEVICTGLQNTLQPLIRYRIGDVARWAINQKCPCRREMPILEAIEGRYEDVCYATDGRPVVRFDTVFKGLNHIREAQVVQEKLDLFTVYLVATPEYNGRDGDTIQTSMRAHIGNVTTRVKVVDAISRTAAGKFRAVVCNLSADEKKRIHQNSRSESVGLVTSVC